MTAVLFFLISCTEQSKTEKGLFQLNHIVEKKANLSDLLDSVEYIALETTDESLLPGLSKLLCVKDNFYASAETEVMKFDSNGRFIGKLSMLGNGPQDYLSINDYDIVLLLTDGVTDILADKDIKKSLDKKRQKESKRLRSIVNAFFIAFKIIECYIIRNLLIGVMICQQ